MVQPDDPDLARLDPVDLDAAYDDLDWAGTLLGPREGWSPALLGALDLVRGTQFPATLLWGPQFVLLYNEAYIPILADKHPKALGAPAREVFPEAWDTIEPLLISVLAGEGAVKIDEAFVPLQRRGALQESWFNFSYSAVRSAPVTAQDVHPQDERHAELVLTGPGRSAPPPAIEGVIDIVMEVTAQVQDRRRLALLSDLHEALSDVADLTDAVHRALDLLRSAGSDLDEVDIHWRGATSPAAPGPPAGVGLPVAPSRAAHSWLGSDVLLEQTATGTLAWFWLSSSTEGPNVSPFVLVVRLHPMLAADVRYLRFLQLVAAALTQAFARAQVREERRRTELAGREMSEALQRSLLDRPAMSDRFEVAVRYQPAAERAQIGGDWYDAFDQREDVLAVVVGDVSGHDREAAVTMAQVRNLLRGVALTSGGRPSQVLSGLESAMHSLAVDAYATAVLAHVITAGNGAGAGGEPEVVVRWANAGHPPPVLISPAGTAALLEADTDVLLGLQVERGRRDHEVALQVGASLVLYTDGLVERRGTSLQEALVELQDFLHGRQELGAEQLCDELVERFGVGAEDDTVVLVLRRRS